MKTLELVLKNDGLYHIKQKNNKFTINFLMMATLTFPCKNIKKQFHAIQLSLYFITQISSTEFALTLYIIKYWSKMC